MAKPKHNPVNNLGAFAHPPKPAGAGSKMDTKYPAGKLAAIKPAKPQPTGTAVARVMDAAELAGQNPNNIALTTSRPPAPTPTKPPMVLPQRPKPGPPMKKGK